MIAGCSTPFPPPRPRCTGATSTLGSSRLLVVASGDLVAIETLTNHAGDAPDLMMDPQIAEVFAP